MRSMGRMRIRSPSICEASDDLISSEETGADVRTATAMLIDILSRNLPVSIRIDAHRESNHCLRTTFRAYPASALLQYEVRERSNVSHEKHHNPHQTSQRNAVEEDVTQNVTFVSIPLGSGTGDDNALRVNHLAHDAAGTVGRGHENGRNAHLLGRNLLQAAEEHVGGSVGAGQSDSHPSQQGSEERIEVTGAGESQSHGRVESCVTREEAYSHHGGNRHQGESHPHNGLQIDLEYLPDAETHDQSRDDRGDEDSGSGGTEPIEIKYRRLLCILNDHRRRALHQFVQAMNRESRTGDLAGRRAPSGHRAENLFRGIQHFLEGNSAPAKDDDAENEPGQPGASDFSAAKAVGSAMVGLLFFAFEGPYSLGVPHL